MYCKESISTFPLFNDLTDSEIERIGSVSRQEHYQAGTRVFQEGRANGSLFGVMKGSLRISKKARFDEDQILSTFRTGDFFGEVGFVNGGNHSVSADALENTEVLRIDRSDFEALVDENPRLGYKVILKMARQMGRFLTQMDEQYVDLCAYVWGRSKR